jgi:hypothetical protein
MEREWKEITAVIANGAAVSGVIDATWAAGAGLIAPSALTATTVLAFKVCGSQDGTFVALYDRNNALVEVAVTVNAAKAYALPDELFAWPYFKLWTEASGADVNQAAERSFVVVLKS